MSTQLLAGIAVAGLALAGYAGAASEGLLPESLDMGLGVTKRCERAANVSAELAERCQNLAQRGGRGAMRRCAVADDSAEGLAEKCAMLRDHGRGKGPGGKGGHSDLAPFRVDEANGTVEGRWVSFAVDGATGTIADYTSKGPFADVVLFDAIVAPNSDDDGMKARGPLWLGREGAVYAAAFNAPNAFFAAKNTGAGSVTVTFDVGDGITVEQTERGIVLSNDGHRALLAPRQNATLSLSGDVVTATLAPGDAVVFAIEGYPRILAHEVQVLRHLAQAWQDRPDGPAEPAMSEVPVEA